MLVDEYLVLRLLWASMLDAFVVCIFSGCFLACISFDGW